MSGRLVEVPPECLAELAALFDVRQPHHVVPQYIFDNLDHLYKTWRTKFMELSLQIYSLDGAWREDKFIFVQVSDQTY